MIDNTILITVALVFAGGVARTVIKYLNEWLKTKEKFDWRYVAHQLIGWVSLVLLALVTGQIGNMDALAAFSYGYLAADIGREVVKGYGTIRNGRATDIGDNIR